MTKLESIEEKTVTQQQENGFNAYAEMISESMIEASDVGFQSFYANWCYEKSLFNDINQSNF